VLFADDTGWWVGVGGAVVAVVSGVVAAVVVFRKDWRAARRDSIAEWQITLDDLRKELKDVKEELHRVRNEDNTRITDLYAKHEACQVENKFLHAEIDRLTEEVKVLRGDVKRGGRGRD
jgi:peptidoglycan hydrolase CwlO-like protein